jgi:hypothetical protein
MGSLPRTAVDCRPECRSFARCVSCPPTPAARPARLDWKAIIAYGRGSARRSRMTLRCPPNHSERIARLTVKEYLDRAPAAGLSWEIAAGLSEEELDRRVSAAADTRQPDRPLPDWEQSRRS